MNSKNVFVEYWERFHCFDFENFIDKIFALTFTEVPNIIDRYYFVTNKICELDVSKILLWGMSQNLFGMYIKPLFNKNWELETFKIVKIKLNFLHCTLLETLMNFCNYRNDVIRQYFIKISKKYVSLPTTNQHNS